MKAIHLVFLPVLLCTAHASTVSFVGNLGTDANAGCEAGCSTDDEFVQFGAVIDSFTVGTTSTMQAVTFSYGGGVNGNGQSIAEGGFAPYLSLFDGSGNFLASTYFGTTCPSGAHTNSVTNNCYDELLDGGTLAPGTYQIAISAFSNLSFAENYGAGTLADGFTGLGNPEVGEDLHYAFDVILTSTSPVPEPRSTYSILGGVLLLILMGRRAKSSMIIDRKF